MIWPFAVLILLAIGCLIWAAWGWAEEKTNDFVDGIERRGYPTEEVESEWRRE